MNTKCIACSRLFVNEIKDLSTECIKHTAVCIYEEIDLDTCSEIGFICIDCYTERKRHIMLRDRAERELTPKKKRKRKEK